jgi:glycerol-3-phosphate dehydrogenase
VGLRPLVRPTNAVDGSTKSFSREHTVLASPSGLVTVTGGKWTTYRAMAEDVLAHCASTGLLPPTAPGVTRDLRLIGAEPKSKEAVPVSAMPGLHSYGSEAQAVAALPGADRSLGWGLTEAMVRFAARHEYARTAEDVLARRSRLLFLDARLAGSLAGEVGDILEQETGQDPRVEAMQALAARYLELPA